MRIAKAMPRRAAVAPSVGIAEKLRDRVGEELFLSILQTISRAVPSMPSTLDGAQMELAGLRLRNAARVGAKRAVILNGAVSSDVAGKFISRSRPVVHKMAKSGELLAVEDGRFLRFPHWQFDDQTEDGLVPGLRRVLLAMDASPFQKAAWLVSPNRRFRGKAPIDLLRAGKIDQVYEEAIGVISS
jgi:hypothetical protein